MSSPLRHAALIYRDWRSRTPKDLPLSVRVVLKQGEELFFNGLLVSEPAGDGLSNGKDPVVIIGHEIDPLPVVVLCESDVVFIEFQTSANPPEPFGFAPR